MARKLGAESSGQILGNTPLQIASYSSGTNYLKMIWGISPANQAVLEKGLGK
jgi:hypothetical protein